jgi:hypothetical protein
MFTSKLIFNQIYNSLSLSLSFLRKLKVIDCDEFRERTEAIDLTTFHTTCKRHMDSSREQLAKRYYQIISIFFFIDFYVIDG